MTAHVHVAGHRVTAGAVHVPSTGPWFADVTLEDAPDMSGAQTLSIGALDFVGTIDPRYNSTFGLRRMFRLVGGANGWGKILAPKSYHADNGVRSRLVAEDAAREAGETLAAFSPSGVIGNDFVRRAGAASVTLEAAAAGVPWWVDYDGTTHVEAHPSTTPVPASYEIATYDPAARLLSFQTDDVGAVRIGATLTARLDAPVIVRELDITIGEDLHVSAWCGPADTAQGRLLDAMRAILARATAGRIYGPVRYRVGQMSGDRYELQAVRRGAGFPDVIPASAWPGAAGSHSVAAPGAEVLVQFIEGDPSMPVLTHFAGKDGVGWTPVEAILAASSLVRLGSATANRALALATETKADLDTLQSKHDGHVHPFTGTGTVQAVVAPYIVGPLSAIASAKVVTDG